MKAPDEIPERLDPLTGDFPWPRAWRYHHLFRYWLVGRWTRGARVLDIGCGYGYGAYLLAKRSEQVVGLDVSAGVIEVAQSRYQRTNLQFIVGDAERIALQPPFDTVICLENIEHLANPRAMLAEAARLLRPGGRLIVSTPNALRTRAKNNPHHEREFSPDELRALLGEQFGTVRIFGQYLRAWRRLAVLRRLEQLVPITTLIPTVLGMPAPRYAGVLLAIAKR